jgi:glycosyltransferase involved in cell wall biosynthesis
MGQVVGNGPPRRLLFVVNVGWFFVSHRLPIASAAKRGGYEVHVATALDRQLDAETPATVAAHGLILHKLAFSRSGAHPLELVRDLLKLRSLFRSLEPDVVHLVTLKPILLGGLAARLAGVKSVVLAVPGRGSVFSARGVIATLRRWSALALYRLAYQPGHNRVIVQNVEDRDYFIARRVFRARDVRLIRGSGAPIDTFVPRPEALGRPVVVMASRMLREKGVADFVAAAALLRQGGTDASFVLIGDVDLGNPHSHTREELQAWVAEGAVEWWGFRSDMAAVFASTHVVCLPTVYGEGVPKVLIEAAASGRPIVCTDVPGCRDIVRHEYNGLLVRPRDPSELASALSRLLASAELRRRMGDNGRALVENEFSLDIVIRQTLALYAEVLA